MVIHYWAMEQWRVSTQTQPLMVYATLGTTTRNRGSRLIWSST